jgi:phosphocarrier protein HPr
MASSGEFVIKSEVGLHARPAAIFVKKAASFASDVRIENLSNSKGPVNAKSMLSLMTAGVEHNHKVRIIAEGPDEEEAIEIIGKLIEDNFPESEG